MAAHDITEISLTETAAVQVRELLKQEGLEGENAFLRIGAKEGGCSGLSYIMQFETEKADDDQVFESHGIKILCDTASYFNLAGVTLDFQGGLGGQGFMFENPNARTTCGCGKSFG
ncbi:MAG: iron-sulfur cluster assembly accessory protein [Deltaproteobacteria bacterium]|nr:iron-sulfur cluster assembly accessory protein [bacterium]MCB9477540.1 iron-sulfur cluster assembly accessory protein [Deltaproteobacteria bacterium]MCB9478113.1 iron-sulfur cluster assembly accessory protein [Deltaproteobacteria bacterium]MCB9487609.1 iron-sulfur cluster assembly accessory protein [Deltaproteobacteria bacterium]